MRKDRSKQTKQIFLAAIIAFIMITSVIGFMAGRDSEQNLSYGDFSFVRKGNIWVTKINGQNLNFYYFPSETTDIELDDAVKNRISSTPMVYLTYDPDQENVEYIAQTQFELENIFSSNFNIYSTKAFTKENEYGLPVITCLNATDTIPVIDLRKTNETAIHLEGNCIIFESRSGFDFLRAKDRLFYGLFNVIK